ncbi:MAG: cytochrome P450 [Pseudomonadales bacterium]|nr:cytochrome P450 [Pseudomonadales bacterium]
MDSLDLSSYEFIQAPYDTYASLLKEQPIYHCAEKDFYYVASHPLVSELFTHPNLSSNRVRTLTQTLPEPFLKAIEPLTSSLSKWLLFMDPPRHTQLRKLVNASLSRKVVAELSPKIDAIAELLLTDITQSWEVMSQFAYPLPMLVISDLLGVPEEDQTLIKNWSANIARFLGDKTTPDDVRVVQQSIIEATGYFRDHLKAQKAQPSSHLIQNLINFQQADSKFEEEDLIANLIALIFAGHETTTNGIGNAINLLIQNANTLPDNQTLLDNIESVVEECLRFQSPVQRMGRVTTQTVEIGGIEIPANKRVLLLIGAANRDPKVFSNPDSFQFDRADTKHLAFGYGIHHCSGAHLARIEMQIALSHFLRKFDLKRANVSESKIKKNLGLRSFEKLIIEELK